MKKLLFGILVIVLLIVYTVSISHPQQKKQTSTFASPTPTIVPVTLTNKILFVPYWTVNGGIDGTYNEYVYFGVVPDKTGIVRTDSGYQNMQTFVHAVPTGTKKLLGVRMVNTTINESILHNDALQQKVIADAVSIAQDNGFDGILLDLEYSAFPFDSVIQSVTTFSKQFADITKSHSLLFYQTVYGDTYYRGRPYTVKDLAKNADRILIMAYDFHKANGDPGANFPLEMGSEGYSFKEMVNNFTKDVSLSKLTVIFGMFGYDWKVNEKGNSVGQAESLSTNEMLQKFVGRCLFKNCSVVQNASLETNVTYEDSTGQKHEVWFEDRTSIIKKEEVLEKNGISSVGFWANGYF